MAAQSMIAFAVTALLAVFPAACGKDKDDKKDDKKNDSGDATSNEVVVDGQKVPFMTLGDVQAYEGQLAEQEGLFTYDHGRAFKLDGGKTLLVKNAEGSSSDCASGEDYGGPSYMVLKVDGEKISIVRSTDEIEADGVTIPATDIAQFPGALDAGTYVLSISYFSGSKACHVNGSFALAE